MPEKAIIDTSVLIALERINMLDILCKIYSHIILPEAVVSEFGSLSVLINLSRRTIKFKPSHHGGPKSKDSAFSIPPFDSPQFPSISPFPPGPLLSEA